MPDEETPEETSEDQPTDEFGQPVYETAGEIPPERAGSAGFVAPEVGGVAEGRRSDDEDDE